MACATLKRTHEYENATTHPSKKRRCNFLNCFEKDPSNVGNSNTNITPLTANGNSNSLVRLTGDENAGGSQINNGSNNNAAAGTVISIEQNQQQFVNERSAFKEANIIGLSPNKIRDDIQQHAHYMQKNRRNFIATGCPSTSAQASTSLTFERMQQDSNDSSGSESPQRDNHQHTTHHHPQHHQQQQHATNDKAVFTLKQVQQICERMLKEKENQIRTEYDDILTKKLAEQYDQFVKFTFDQIQNNYRGTTSSYLT